MVRLALISRRIFVPVGFANFTDIEIQTFVLPEETQQKVYDLLDEVSDLTFLTGTDADSSKLDKQAEKIADLMNDEMIRAGFVSDFVLVDGIPLFFVPFIVEQLHVISLDSATLIAKPPKTICVVQMNMGHKRII